MIDRKQGGSIVQISSILTTTVVPGSMTLSGTKAALDQMMKVMALEWGPHQVRTIRWHGRSFMHIRRGYDHSFLIVINLQKRT